MVTDSRLITINQMILATIFGVGLLMVIFALLFLPTSPTASVLTIVGTLITQLGTVVIMQNTHFFKPNQTDPASPGVTNHAPVTNIHAQTVSHGGNVPPINPSP